MYIHIKEELAGMEGEVYVSGDKGIKNPSGRERAM